MNIITTIKLLKNGGHRTGCWWIRYTTILDLLGFDELGVGELENYYKWYITQY